MNSRSEKGDADLIERLELRHKGFGFHGIEDQDVFRRIVEAAVDSILIYQDQRIVFANQAAADQLGAISPEQLIGRHMSDLAEDASTFVERCHRLYRDGEPVNMLQTRRRRLDGKLFDVEITGSSVMWDGRSATLCIARDITERQRMESALKESESRFRNFIEVMPDAVVIQVDGLIAYANPAAAKGLGAPDPESLQGRSLLDFIMPIDRSYVRGQIEALIERGGSTEISGFRRTSPDGSWRDIESVAVNIVTGNKPAILSVCRDVTDRKRTEVMLEENEARFRALAEQSTDPTFAYGHGKIVFANAALARLLKVDDPKQLIGRNPLDFLDQESRVAAAERVAEINKGMAGPKQMRGRLRLASGERHDLEWTSIPFVFNRLPGAYVILRDVTQRLRIEAEHRYLASHDPLTQLPNRTEFQKRLHELLARPDADRQPLAIHYLDLDFFKNINDTLGHLIGDEVLRFVADRLRSTVRSQDIVARLGGDEFAIIQTDLRGRDSAKGLAEKLQKIVDQPYAIGQQLLHTSATIGIALYPDHGRTPEHLLRNADLALYQAKDWGRNAISFFSQDLDQRAQRRETLVSELVRAESNREFEIHFQPIANTKSGDIEAVEALIRWQHPKRGLLTADEFIQAVEASREAQRISIWVLRTACHHAMSWTEQGLPPLRLAVNLSMPLLQRPDLVQIVSSALDRTGLDPKRLELELTERMIITAGTGGGLASRLIALRELGVHIALDDFGTGYSSLSLLKDFPIDRIKIDRSFVAGFGTNADDTAIVRAITNLGRSLDKRITAEGVECSETLDLLRAEGCDEVQGFHLARPMSADNLSRFLRNVPPSSGD